MMCREEAVEEILRGPFAACARCAGHGILFDKGATPQCTSCRGSGKWRRYGYVEACIVLNREPVEVPRAVRTLPTGKTVSFGTPGASDLIDSFAYAKSMNRVISIEDKPLSAIKYYETRVRRISSLPNLIKPAVTHGQPYGNAILDDPLKAYAETDTWSPLASKADYERKLHASFQKEYMGEWVGGVDMGETDDDRRSRRDHFEGQEDGQVPSVPRADEERQAAAQRKLRKL